METILGIAALVLFIMETRIKQRQWNLLTSIVNHPALINLHLMDFKSIDKAIETQFIF